MGQALFISNNEVLNDIYSVNLEAYLGMNVTVLANTADALQLLQLSPNYNLIVCLCLIDGTDAAMDIGNFIKEKKLETPMIVLGRQSDLEASEQFFILPASYNVKSVIKTAAKALEITPKDMVSKVVPEYYPIPVKLFCNFGVVNTDIYFRVKKNSGNEYIKIFNKGTEISDGIRKYKDEGVQNLFVDAMDRLSIINKVSDLIIDDLGSDEVTLERKIEVVEQGIEVLADQLFENPEVTEELAQISNACVESIGKIIDDNPRLDKLLTALLDNKSGYIYSHSIMTSFIAAHIVNNISWGGESHVEKLNFAIFFHDMYLVAIYNRYPDARIEEDLVFGDNLSDNEKKLVLNHARLAGEMVQKFPRAPMGADAIIIQHHGMTSGVGFATKYKDDISPLAKVIIIAESFAEEIMQLIDEASVGAFDKDPIIEKLLERFPMKSYQKITETLRTIKI